MEVNLNSPVSNRTSYGITAINIIRSLTALGVRVNSIPISSQADWLEDQPEVPQSLENGKTFNLDSPSIRLFHQHSLIEHVGRGENVGFPIFELDRLNSWELTNVNSCDKLFVTSKWAKEVCVASGAKIPIKVVPLGVDSSVFSPEPPKGGKPFTFFFPGKFEYRKGFDIVVDVFERAFDKKDDFQLIFLPQNLFISNEDTEQWIKYLTGTKFGDKFKIIGRQETHHNVAELTRYADCVVSFSRAEGWNLPLLEALSCGRQVLATNYSAQTEFLTDENAVLMNFQEREEAFDGVFFKGGGNWLSYSDSDLETMAGYLRAIFKAGPVYNLSGIETARKFSWQNTAKKIISSLGE